MPEKKSALSRSVTEINGRVYLMGDARLLAYPLNCAIF
jgi:hypothetical protein